MKPNTVVIGSLFAIGILLLGYAAWSSLSPEPVAAPATPAPTHAKTPLPPKFGEPVHVDAPPPVMTDSAEADHEEKVQTRIQELMDLAMMDDQASLKKIWAELSNPDKAIREGAVDAVVQFGDRSKVNALRTLAQNTDDPDEKAHILAAADQLALPPMNLMPGATQVDTPLPPQTAAP